MEALRQDLRYALRILAKSPGFTAAAVLSLALGIGANTAIFSLVNALLLRSSPVEAPARVVRVYPAGPDGRFHSVSYPDYEALRSASRTLEGLSTFTTRPLSLSTGGQAERVTGEIVSGDFFRTLGLRPASGRFFIPEEGATAGTHPVVVLGNGLWLRRFGGDPAVVGRTIGINGRNFTVIGVAQPSFSGVSVVIVADLWIPVMMADALFPMDGFSRLTSTEASWLNMIGRLAPGASRPAAEAELGTIVRRLAAARGQRVDAGATPMRVEPESRRFADHQAQVTAFMAVLMAIVGVVLLVACVNLAGLLLARAAARRREIAIRLAVGAGRGRLLRQLLTESVVLGLGGGVGGVLLALWGTDVLSALRPAADVTIGLDLSLDARVLAFALGISLATAVLFGLAPALHATRTDVVTALKDDAPGGGRRRSRLRDAFVVAQVALSLLLLLGAGLLTRSLRNAGAINPGFDPTDVQVASFDVGIQGYSETRGRVFYDELLDRVRALPGVRAAALAEVVPLGLGNQATAVRVEGVTPPPGERGFTADFNTVTPGYFGTLRIPITGGRDFLETDRADGQRVAIINTTMARRFWPGVDPVGRRFRLGRSDTTTGTEVVGVVADGKYRTLGESPRSYVYFPVSQSGSMALTLHVRTSGDPVAVMGAVRDVARALDPNLPSVTSMTLSRAIDVALLPHRLAAGVAGAFGLVGALLAALGIYSVTAYTVSQRAREFGVRLALGARAGDILGLVLGQGMRLVLIGVAGGVAGALILTRFLSSLMYGISATDPATFAGVTAALGLVALVACWVPARRATRVNPAHALRSE
jgi:predicted permease